MVKTPIGHYNFTLSTSCSFFASTTMAQTPQQRRANERFAKNEAAKRGKSAPVSKPKQNTKAPISSGWVVVLAFVVCGGLILELLRIVPEMWSTVASMLSRLSG